MRKYGLAPFEFCSAALLKGANAFLEVRGFEPAAQPAALISDDFIEIAASEQGGIEPFEICNAEAVFGLREVEFDPRDAAIPSCIDPGRAIKRGALHGRTVSTGSFAKIVASDDFRERARRC